MAAQPDDPGDTTGLIGANLRRIRKDRGLSQRELANLTNGKVVQGDISRIESGATPDPGFSKLNPLAEALGVDIREFWAGGPSIEETLQRFLESDIADDVTEEEAAALKRVFVPWGIPTVRSWHLILTAMRTDKRLK